MGELVRWQTFDGPVVVEVDSTDPGFRSVSRKPGDIAADAQERFEDALERVRGAAVTALHTFRDSSLSPDEVSLEFGVKFSAAAGAVIASTAAEGHLNVTLRWSRTSESSNS